MDFSSREEIREALIEELIAESGSRRSSAAMVGRFEVGDMELPPYGSARARELARRLRQSRAADATR
jgi:hypothetical protein